MEERLERAPLVVVAAEVAELEAQAVAHFSIAVISFLGVTWRTLSCPFMDTEMPSSSLCRCQWS